MSDHLSRAPHPVLAVLVVDDDSAVRGVYRAMLTHDAACSVEEADCGADGLAALARTKFDCVLLDFMLPDMSGIEFLSQRKARSLDHCPVIMITCMDSAIIARRAFQLGVNDYMLKDEVARTTLMPSVRNTIRAFLAKSAPR